MNRQVKDQYIARLQNDFKHVRKVEKQRKLLEELQRTLHDQGWLCIGEYELGAYLSYRGLVQQDIINKEGGFIIYASNPLLEETFKIEVATASNHKVIILGMARLGEELPTVSVASVTTEPKECDVLVHGDVLTASNDKQVRDLIDLLDKHDIVWFGYDWDEIGSGLRVHLEPQVMRALLVVNGWKVQGVK